MSTSAHVAVAIAMTWQPPATPATPWPLSSRARDDAGAGRAVVAGRAAVGRVVEAFHDCGCRCEVGVTELDALVDHGDGDRGAPRTISHARGTSVRCRPHCWPNIGSFGVNSVDGGGIRLDPPSAPAEPPAQPQPPVAGERNGIVSYLIGAISAPRAPLTSEARVPRRHLDGGTAFDEAGFRSTSGHVALEPSGRSASTADHRPSAASPPARCSAASFT